MARQWGYRRSGDERDAFAISGIVLLAGRNRARWDWENLPGYSVPN